MRDLEIFHSSFNAGIVAVGRSWFCCRVHQGPNFSGVPLMPDVLGLASLGPRIAVNRSGLRAENGEDRKVPLPPSFSLGGRLPLVVVHTHARSIQGGGLGWPW